MNEILAKASKCVNCGRKRKLFETFTKYGFCDECNTRIRRYVKSILSSCQSCVQDNKSKSNLNDSELARVKSCIQSLKELEGKRGEIPFFKSSTQELFSDLRNILSSAEAERTLKAEKEFIDKAIAKIYIPERLGEHLKTYVYKDVCVETRHMDNPPALKKEFLGESVEFEIDPENLSDQKAVAVYIDQQKFGYMPKDNKQQMIIDYKKRESPVLGYVTGLDLEKNQFEITLAFYKNPLKNIDKSDAIETSLVGTSKKDTYGNSRQNSYMDIDTFVGEPLFLEYDDGSGIYLVSYDYLTELGEINKKLSKELRDLENDGCRLVACLRQITCNEQGRFGAEVTIYTR